MANSFNVATWITNESLRMLVNKAQIAPFFNTDYNKEFTQSFPIGDTVRVKLPQRYLIREGMGYAPQALTRKYTTVTLDQMFGVDFEWDSVEKALNMERGDELVKREYIDPAMAQIANELDSRCAKWAYQNTPHIVGALATTPTANSDYLKARTLLNQLSCPVGDRGMIVSPGMEAAIVNANTAVFNPSSEISRQYKEGSMGRALGFDWYSSNNLYSHTAGTWGGAVTLTSAPADGATSISVTATASDTFKKGDVICIATGTEVNPVNRRTIGALKQFVVTADMTAVGGGDAADVLNIFPAIYGPGSQYQNVTALPAAGQALTLMPGTTTPSGKAGVNGLALHKEAFALVGVKLEVPTKAEIASIARDPATGLSVRFIRMFDPIQSKMVNRFDVLVGFGNLYADYAACRVASLI